MYEIIIKQNGKQVEEFKAESFTVVIDNGAIISCSAENLKEHMLAFLNEKLISHKEGIDMLELTGEEIDLFMLSMSQRKNDMNYAEQVENYNASKKEKIKNIPKEDR